MGPCRAAQWSPSLTDRHRTLKAQSSGWLGPEIWFSEDQLGWHHFQNDIQAWRSPNSSLIASMTAWSTLTQVLPTFGLAQIGDDVMGHPRNYIIKDVRTIDDDENTYSSTSLSS